MPRSPSPHQGRRPPHGRMTRARSRLTSPWHSPAHAPAVGRRSSPSARSCPIASASMSTLVARACRYSPSFGSSGDRSRSRCHRCAVTPSRSRRAVGMRPRRPVGPGVRPRLGRGVEAAVRAGEAKIGDRGRCPLSDLRRVGRDSPHDGQGVDHVLILSIAGSLPGPSRVGRDGGSRSPESCKRWTASFRWRLWRESPDEGGEDLTGPNVGGRSYLRITKGARCPTT